MNVNYSGPAKTACLYACKIMTIVLSLAACNYSLRNLGIKASLIPAAKRIQKPVRLTLK